MEEDIIQPVNFDHRGFLRDLETILQKDNKNELNYYIENTIINYYKNFVAEDPRIITLDDGTTREITTFEELFQYTNNETINEYCYLCIINFANFMMAYCVYFLNNSIDKNNNYYKLAYYGFIQLIIHFNSLDYILEHNSYFNIHILPHNQDLEYCYFRQNGACYFHSILMYFYYQDYNPIKNLIYKDIKKRFNMNDSVISSIINKLQLLPYLWLASVIFWCEFGIGYYATITIFYNKFLNMFSWYGEFRDKIYHKPIQNGKQAIKVKTDIMLTGLEIEECVSRRFDAEYKTSTHEILTGLYIYLSFRDFKYTFNNALSVSIAYNDTDKANHAVVMDFYQQYNGSPIKGRIYDSNYGIEDFECSFNYDPKADYEHQWYLFIKSTPIIEKNFNQPLVSIGTTNLFMNCFTFNLYDIHFQDCILFNILDCNLDNNIITYQPTKLYDNVNLITVLEKIDKTFLLKMKSSLANARDNFSWLKIINGQQFQIIKDIPNFISSDPIISKKTIIERIEYFINNNKFYVNKTYLLIENVINDQTKYYLYIDNGLFFNYADIYNYIANKDNIRKYTYYHLNQYLQFEPVNLLYGDIFYPNLYFLQEIINIRKFFKGGLIKNNSKCKYIFILFIMIIFIIILLIVSIVTKNKNNTKFLATSL